MSKVPHVIRLHRHGGPEQLRWEPAGDIGTPGPGQVRLRQTAVGLNYIDVYHRNGLYPIAAMPAVIGMEAAGEVAAVGPDVPDLSVGDGVAYAGVLGGYATERLIAADRVVPLPKSISAEVAAGMMLQGMTASYLLRETTRVGPGTVLLFHAAAGGVGLIACQWARHLGATVIGTVGSAAKAELAAAHGCHHVINLRTEDFAARVREMTGGAGCDVVYDSIGRDTFPASLDCLKPRGLWVSFGNASGPVAAFDLSILSAKGSLYATRPSLMTYTAARTGLLENARALFDVVERGVVKVAINQRFALQDAAVAHRALEARQTTGSTILTVQ